MGKEVIQLAEGYVERYVVKQTKRAIARVEEMKGKPETAAQTVEVAVRLANEWMDFLAPEEGPKFHYSTRLKNGRTEIFQEIEVDHGKHKSSSGDMEEA